MNNTLMELIGVDPATKWVLRIIAVAFSALCIWMFLFRNGLPEGLGAMTSGIWGTVCLTAEKSKNKIETLLNKDIDGNGKIGDAAGADAIPAGAPVTPAAQVVAPVEAAPAEPTTQVIVANKAFIDDTSPV